jgi:hypothetical protein
VRSIQNIIGTNAVSIARKVRSFGDMIVAMVVDGKVFRNEALDALVVVELVAMVQKCRGCNDITKRNASGGRPPTQIPSRP